MARRYSTAVLGLMLLSSTGQAQEPLCVRTSEVRIPLTDPGGLGLYDGTNERPAAHTAAGIAAGLRVLDNPGRPIGFIGIGQSVTKTRFKQLMDQNNKGRFGNVVMVNCAKNGYTAENWANPNLAPWIECDQALALAGLLPSDVRVVYMEFTRTQPAPPLTEAQFTALLTQEWQQIVSIGRQRFVNWEQAFPSGRTFGGWDQQFYNGEPYAWATNLVARQLVLESIANPTQRPWMDWGTPPMYLWADGDNPRAYDGYTVLCNPLPIKNGVYTFAAGHVIDDMIHPTKLGRQQEGALLQATLDTDPATAWWRQ